MKKEKRKKVFFGHEVENDNGNVFYYGFLLKHIADSELQIFKADYKNPNKRINEIRSRINSNAVLELDLPLNLAAELTIKENEYLETRNFIYVIEALLIAHKAGLYPPLWVLNCLAEVFDDWRTLQNTKSLDELFEINGQVGKASFFKTKAIENRDCFLSNLVFNLNFLFNFSIENACKIVSKGLKEVETEETIYFKIRNPSVCRLKKIYLETKEKFGFSIFQKVAERYTRQDKIEFLRQFSGKEVLEIKNKKGCKIKDLIYNEEFGVMK